MPRKKYYEQRECPICKTMYTANKYGSKSTCSKPCANKQRTFTLNIMK